MKTYSDFLSMADKSSFNNLETGICHYLFVFEFYGAEGGNRTPMGLLPPDFESGASTNSTTSAYSGINRISSRISEEMNCGTNKILQYNGIKFKKTILSIFI